MSKSSKCLHDLQGMSRGMTKVADSFVKMQLAAMQRNANQLFTNDLEHIRLDLENKLTQLTAKSPSENFEKFNEKANAFAQQAKTLFKANAFTPFSFQKRSFHNLNVCSMRNYSQKPNGYTSVNENEKNKVVEKFEPKLNKFSKERQVPGIVCDLEN